MIFQRPAKNAKEAFQWLYFAYLAAIKTQNGAAMSVGRVSTFLDIYIERDMANGVLTEKEAQELVDHITMKFRMVKFARIESYNQLFSGDPVWATARCSWYWYGWTFSGYEDMISVSCIR